MKKGLLFFIFLISLPAVFADIIMPWSFITMPVIPVIVFVEVLVFWFFFRKYLLVNVKLLRIVGVVLAANLATSLIGTLIPLYRSLTTNLMWIGLAFVMSVFVEWGICIPFFRKFRIGLSNLFKIVLVANIITYAMIVSFLFYTGELSTSKYQIDPYNVKDACKNIEFEIESVCMLPDEGFETNYEVVIFNYGEKDIHGFAFRFSRPKGDVDKYVKVSEGMKHMMAQPIRVGGTGLSGIVEFEVTPIVEVGEPKVIVNCFSNREVWNPENDDKIKVVDRCD